LEEGGSTRKCTACGSEYHFESGTCREVEVAAAAS